MIILTSDFRNSLSCSLWWKIEIFVHQVRPLTSTVQPPKLWASGLAGSDTLTAVCHMIAGGTRSLFCWQKPDKLQRETNLPSSHSKGSGEQRYG